MQSDCEDGRARWRMSSSQSALPVASRAADSFQPIIGTILLFMGGMWNMKPFTPTIMNDD